MSLQPNWPLIFSGETITVGCDISRVGYTEWHEYTEWEYEWSKPNSNTIPTNNGYIISSATVSNSGNYRCMGKPKRDLYSSTAWSNVITLIVSRKLNCAKCFFCIITPIPWTLIERKSEGYIERLHLL